MKILVLGSQGMAGHVVSKYLKIQGFSVTTAARSKADIYLNVEDTLSLSYLEVRLQEFDYVINCIGLLVKNSELYPYRAITINSWFPQWLAYNLKDLKTKLVHISTDCVFNGSKGYYSENDKPDETNWYGRSKTLGEVINDKDVTFRTSIIGPELKLDGTGLMHWILNQKEKKVFGWNNAFWNGITTLQLAKCIEKYFYNNLTGLYHLVNNDINITKYELLCLIKEIYNLNAEIIKIENTYQNKILLDTRQELDFKILDYKNQLQELKEFYDQSYHCYTNI